MFRFEDIKNRIEELEELKDNSTTYEEYKKWHSESEGLKPLFEWLSFFYK